MKNEQGTCSKSNQRGGGGTKGKKKSGMELELAFMEFYHSEAKYHY